MAPEESSYVLVIVARDLKRLTCQCIIVSVYRVYNKLFSCSGEGFVPDEFDES